MDMNKQLAAELSLREEQVEKTVALLDEGNTIPFISRYRKEVTGGLDDTVLRKLEERLRYLRNIEARKAEVLKLIADQEKLTPEIEAAIAAAATITEVDDIYRPFRPHRKTRASVARERGLAPLAEALIAQEKTYDPDLQTLAATFIDENGKVTQALGETHGNILFEETGTNGFGYDSLFLSDDLGKSFGLATEQEKDGVSHRARAMRNLFEKLNTK